MNYQIAGVIIQENCVPRTGACRVGGGRADLKEVIRSACRFRPAVALDRDAANRARARIEVLGAGAAKDEVPAGLKPRIDGGVEADRALPVDFLVRVSCEDPVPAFHDWPKMELAVSPGNHPEQTCLGSPSSAKAGHD